jgi:uncharacterized membrane protein (UPF0127 family)
MRLRLFLVLALSPWLALPARAGCPAPAELRSELVRILGESGVGPRQTSFQVEIADTDAARSAGLMCRRSLPADAGMLFIYPRAHVVRMWMKNTWIPLDMLFIASDGRIVRIVPDIAPQQPGRISSDARVKMVLELPAGSAARHGIRAGDRLIRPLKPSPRASG